MRGSVRNDRPKLGSFHLVHLVHEPRFPGQIAPRGFGVALMAVMNEEQIVDGARIIRFVRACVDLASLSAPRVEAAFQTGERSAGQLPEIDGGQPSDPGIIGDHGDDRRGPER